MTIDRGENPSLFFPDEECPYCKEKDEAVDAVIEALWVLMHDAITNYMPAPIDKDKVALKQALYRMMEQF